MLILAWIFAIMFNKRKIMPNPLTWPIIIFLFVNFISIFVAGNTIRAAEVFVFVSFMAFVGIVAANMINSKEAIKKVIKVLFWSTLVVCIFALYQFFGDLIGLSTSLTGLREAYTKAIFGFPRVMAFSNEPLYLANFLFIPLGVGLSLYLNRGTSFKQSWLFAFLGLIILIYVLTASRGAYVGLAAMILFFLVVMAKRIFTIRNVVTISAILGIVILSSWAFLSYAEPQALNEFISRVKLEDINVAESSVGRLQAYEQAIVFWKESPIIGIGVGNYGPKVKDFPDPSTVTGWDIVNNEYLEILAETGVLGLGAFLLILVLLFWRAAIAYYKTNDIFLKSLIVGLSAALVGILVQYIFFSTLYIMYIWVLIGLIIGVENLCFLKEDK
jgi:O-antigen ligase